MFAPNPKARGDLTPGTLYALFGEKGLIYYGQVTPDEQIGFFRRRDHQVAETAIIIATPIMSVVGLWVPTIGLALRAGRWKKLGRFDVVNALRMPAPSVQWPVGTLIVTVDDGANPLYETRVDDPAIQNFEVAAAWDAGYHIPARLTADYGAEEAEWHVGGPVWRERKVKEEYAKRFPEAPWHKLPDDWVTTDVR